MKYETVRIYGKSRPVGWHPDEKDYPSWKEYAKALRGCIYEVDYDEYHLYEDGTICISQGTEDFSVERAHFTRYDMKVWYGKLNKGGRKVWEDHRTVKVTTATPSQLLRILKREAIADDYKVVKF